MRKKNDATEFLWISHRRARTWIQVSDFMFAFLSSIPTCRNQRVLRKVEAHLQSQYGICHCHAPKEGWARSIFSHNFWSLSCDIVTSRSVGLVYGLDLNKSKFRESEYVFLDSFGVNTVPIMQKSKKDCDVDIRHWYLQKTKCFEWVRLLTNGCGFQLH